jgi:hypothetical protein
LKKSRLYLGLGWQKWGVVFGIIAAIISTHPVSARVLMGGGTQAQIFDLPANGGTASPQTDLVTLPDPHNTFSIFSAPRHARPQSPSVILLWGRGDLNQPLPDFPSLATRQQPFRAGPSLKGYTTVVF